MTDDFGPVCDNPACVEQIKRLNEQITRMDTELANARGEAADLRQEHTA